MNPHLKSPVIDSLIILYYVILILFGISQILYLPLPFAEFIVNFLFAWSLIPLATLAIIGMLTDNKLGIMLTLGAQLMVTLIIGFDSAILFISAVKSNQFDPSQIITLLNLALNLGVLIFVFKRFKTFSVNQQTSENLPLQSITQSEILLPQSTLKSLFQIVVIGLITGIGWVSAVYWVWLRFFTDSPTAIERFSPGENVRIGDLSIKLMIGLIGILVASLVYLFFLAQRKRIDLKKGIYLVILVSILLTFPLLALIISPEIFYPISLPFLFFYSFLLAPLIVCPCITTPNYESFTPILPSLLLIISLNILPILLGYFLIARNRLALIVGIILIIICGTYFETSFLLTSAKSVGETGAKSSINFEVYKPTYLPPNLQLRGSATYGKPYDTFILDLTSFGDLQNRIVQRPAKKQIDDYSALSSTYAFTTPEELLSKKEQGSLNTTQYLTVKKVRINDNETGIFIQVACGYPDPPQKICSQILEFVHLSTRIGIDLDYIGANQEPLSEAELIKIAGSMQKSDDVLNFKPRKYYVKFNVFRPSYLPPGIEFDVNEISSPDMIGLRLMKSGEEIGDIIQRPKDKQVEYYYSLSSPPEQLLINKDKEDSSKYPLIKAVNIAGNNGVLVYVNCKSTPNILCMQILEWVKSNTRIAIEMHGLNKLQSELSEEEMIKIAQTMELQQ